MITSGETTRCTTPASETFKRLLALVEAAVAAQVSLIQLREKNLSARALYELTVRAADITHGTTTHLLVNDRADIALAARADGVHLTTQSLEPGVLRRALPAGFLVGVSTHSLAEACTARDGGADFAVFGPVFETPSKRSSGPPVGLHNLNEAARMLSPFPLIALGGLTRENASEALRAGASGIAAIRLFNNPQSLDAVVRTIRQRPSQL